MADFIDAKNEEIAAVCLQLGIKRLFVFGSALRETIGLERAILIFLLSLAQ
jgi:predicted nucleotidyltransferase